MAVGKKPSLGEVAAKPREGSSGESDDDAYSAAVDELAEVLGVSDVEAFRAAFEAAVMSCK